MGIKSGLKFKLVFSYFLVILVSFGFIAFFLDKNLEEHSLREIKSSLMNQTYLVASQISTEQIKKENVPSLQSVATDLSAKIQCRITVVNAKGKVLADSEKSQKEVLSMDNHANRPEIHSALAGAFGEDIRFSDTLKTDMLYSARALKDNDMIIGAVRLALPLHSVQKILLEVRKTIILGLLFALGLAFILISAVTAQISMPINRIIHAARNFAQGDFSHKVLVYSRDEMGELAVTLNKMASDIEEKIKEVEIQNQHLKAILQSMVEGIIVVDKTARIRSLNSTVEKIFSLARQDAEGRYFLEAIRNNDIAEIITQVLEKRESVSRELVLAWPVQRTFRINASPIFEKEAISGCLLVIHDVTEIRRLETMRRDFVANVSHELKTPLTAIKGFVETLLEGALEDKENNRHFLRIIQEHAVRLDRLVNDLLELSSLESKEITLEKTDVELRDLTEQIIAGFKSQIKKKNIVVKNQLPAHQFIRADKDKIGQVFINLIDNAVKFNQEKGILKIYSEHAGGGLKVIVEDSGVGIPAKDLPRIFERFYRVDKARSRELGGTGLGLSIVKHIVELHGGEVGVESTEGLGSRFWFTLP